MVELPIASLETISSGESSGDSKSLVLALDDWTSVVPIPKIDANALASAYASISLSEWLNGIFKNPSTQTPSPSATPVLPSITKLNLVVQVLLKEMEFGLMDF